MADITLKKLKLLPITDWLRRWARGDQAGIEAAYHALEPYFVRAAISVMRNQRQAKNISPKDLIQEAWLRLSEGQLKQFKNRHHFFGTVVRAMNFYLIDLHRSSLVQPTNKSLLVKCASSNGLQDKYQDIDRTLDAFAALAQLGEKYPRQSVHFLFVELLGFTLQETADLAGRPMITIRRDLDFCEAWLERWREK
jgi:DNA-directed RNA polymerase specialized sigma24 family protein